MTEGTTLLVIAALAIVTLVVMITRFKINPFLALIVVSLGTGAAAGMPLATLVRSFEVGVGNVLGHVALVIALGTMLGKILAESGGAERIARTIIGAVGERRAHWAMGIVSFVVGLPLFFDVGFVLLIPIAFSVARRTGTSMVLIGLPMVAGLSVVHGLIPPTPAPLLAISAYGADMGMTIFYGLLIGIPTTMLAGPVFARFVSRFVTPNPDNPLMQQLTEQHTERTMPGFGITMFTIVLPVGLMLLGSAAHLALPVDTLAYDVARLIGSSVVALLISVFVSFYTLARPCGFGREQIQKFTNECLAPIAAVTLIVGAGAGFGRVLMDSGVSDVVVAIATGAQVSPFVLGWLVAAMIRVATGSATVAATTAAGIVAPVVAATGVSPELMVIATGAGSVILSHVNDGGFWLVKEYFNLTVTQTFKTWTVCETIISVFVLLVTLALAPLV